MSEIINVDEYLKTLDETADINTDSYRIKLEAFEGPLDLLLHLIKRAKIDISEIFVSEITEQYLFYMQELKDVDLERASEFIEMAAWLLEIKSKSLLPKPAVPVPDEEDPQKALIRRLEEYKLYKEASLKMKQQENVGTFFREPDPSVGDTRFVLKDMTMDGLVKALQKMFLKIEQKAVVNKERKITLDRFTVAEMVSNIKDVFLFRDKINFSELFQEDYTKSEIITTFQAMLELLKMQFVKAEQKDTFEDIILRKAA